MPRARDATTEVVARIEEHRRTLARQGPRAVVAAAEGARQVRSRGGPPSDAELVALGAASATLHLGLTPRPNQLVSALRMVGGCVIELPTGEGKTLAAAIAAAALAVGHGSAHVLTVNDYLAERDARWMRPVIAGLGLSVASIRGDDPAATRRARYCSDVVYATHLQVGFDHLRDGLATDAGGTRAPRFDAVIVDEADSILIDECRLPLVISGPGPAVGDLPYRVVRAVEDLCPTSDYEVEVARRRVWLTDSGLARLEEGVGCDLYAEDGGELLRHVHHALRARVLYRRDVHYVVKDREILLVDPYTGRAVLGRRWADGLHQAIEAKERLPLSAPRIPHAQMTVRSLVGLYSHIAGMTGTGREVAREVARLYGLETHVVEPHRPSVRIDHPDQCFESESAKYAAVVEEVVSRHRRGQPLLVGCGSVRECDELSRRLAAAGIPHEALHARDHAREAEVIARAGTPGSVTVATHLAGRGVDIRLRAANGDRSTSRTDLVGLCVIGTERYESARIERQLRGRSGRQGDPGETVFFCATSDLSVASWVPRSRRLSVGARLRIGQRNAEDWNRTLRDDLVAFDGVFEHHRRVGQRLRAACIGDGAELQRHDARWIAHLQALFDLQDGIHLRAWGAQSPIAAFHDGARLLLADFEAGVVDDAEPLPRPSDRARRPLTIADLGPRRTEPPPVESPRPPSARSVAGHQPAFGMGVLLDVIAVADVDGVPGHPDESP